MADFVWFAAESGEGRLLVVLHHLVVDGVSWRILMSDFAEAWQQVRTGKAPELPAVGTSARRWASALDDEAFSPGREAELTYWRDVLEAPDPPLGTRAFDPALDVWSTVDTVRVELPAEVTEAVLTRLPAAYQGTGTDVLLAALALAMNRWRGADRSALVRLEGHGREEDVVPGADLSRTIGWFTSMYPARVDVRGTDLADVLAGGPAAGTAIKLVKEQLRAVPDKGMGYGLLRHLNPETAAQLAELPVPQLGFNYLGRISDSDVPEHLRADGWGPASWSAELIALPDPDLPALSALEVNSVATDTADGTRLQAAFMFATGVLSRERTSELAELWVEVLHGMAAHAARPQSGGLTPSDAPLVSVRQDEIEEWEERYGRLVQVWPQAPGQSGIQFQAALADGTFDVYHMQFLLHLSGQVDPARMRAAGQALLERYPNLRSAFLAGADGDPVQVVAEHVALPWRHIDLTGLGAAEQDAAVDRALAQDRADQLDPTRPPLFRLALLTCGPQQAKLVITAHHTLFDGWSSPLVIKDLVRLYAGTEELAPVRGYGDYLGWLSRQDRDASAARWQDELAGFDRPTLLAADIPEKGEASRLGRVEVPLSIDKGRELARRAAELGVTLNTLLQGAWAVLLSKLTGQHDVVFGAAVNGRPADLAGSDEMVGLFINTLPTRVSCRPDQSVGEVVTDLQDRQISLLDHHYYGLADIQRGVGLPALFDTIVVFENYPIDREGIVEANGSAGFTIDAIRPFAGSHYPLTLNSSDPYLRLSLDYQNNLFDRDAAEVIAARLVRVLDQVLEDPKTPVGAVEVLAEDERDWLVRRVNDTAHPVDADTLPGAFEDRVERDPDRVAVIGEKERLTYDEFNRRANRLAHWLVEQGAGPERLVAVRIPRSVDLMVAIYAVVKAGAAYLPVDTELPEDRVRHVLDSARPLLVLDADLPDVSGYPETNPRARAVAGQRRVRHLHLRLHRRPQGRAGGPPVDHEPAEVGPVALRRRRRGPGAAEHDGELRRLGAGAVRTAAGRGRRRRRAPGRAPRSGLPRRADPAGAGDRRGLRALPAGGVRRRALREGVHQPALDRGRGRGVPRRAGRQGRRGAARLRSAQPLRAHRGIGGGHGVAARAGCRPGADRRAGVEHPGVRPGRGTAPGRTRGHRRAVPRRCRAGQGLPGADGADREPVRRLPLRRAGDPDVPHRRCRAVEPGRPGRVHRQVRLPGEDPWVPYRAGGDRAGADRAPGRRRRGGRGA